MLKVYVTGLIFFNGCNDPQMFAYAPDGTTDPVPHFASLWIAPHQIQENATTWWNDSRPLRTLQLTGGGPGDRTADMVEFRIPEPVDLWFPDLADGQPHCEEDLGKKLPKLRQKDKKGDEKDFVVDADAAITIAKVTINGGTIAPRRLSEIGVVEWTITNHGPLQITAVPKGGGSPRTITLNAPAPETAAEVVFSNMHTVPFDGSNDPLAQKNSDEHLQLFAKLNPNAEFEGLVTKKPIGAVGQVATDYAFMEFIRDINYTDGENPPCCPN